MTFGSHWFAGLVLVQPSPPNPGLIGCHQGLVHTLSARPRPGSATSRLPPSCRSLESVTISSIWSSTALVTFAFSVETASGLRPASCARLAKAYQSYGSCKSMWQRVPLVLFIVRPLNFVTGANSSVYADGRCAQARVQPDLI